MTRHEKILRILFKGGPIPEGFANIEKDCYEYASDVAGNKEPTKQQSFEGWLRMIEDFGRLEDGK